MHVSLQNSCEVNAVASRAADGRTAVLFVHGGIVSLLRKLDGRAHRVRRREEAAMVHAESCRETRPGRRMDGNRARYSLPVVLGVEPRAHAGEIQPDGRARRSDVLDRSATQETPRREVGRCVRVLRCAGSRLAHRTHHSALSRRRRCVGQPDTRVSAVQLHEGSQDCGGVRPSTVRGEA